jgi:putative transcriptional regulator
MTQDDILDLRKKLGLNQIEFGNLFGVHPMTVSKWERGTLFPNNYQLALMKEFLHASKSKEVRSTIGSVLVGAGIAAALYLLLKHSRN